MYMRLSKVTALLALRQMPNLEFILFLDDSDFAEGKLFRIHSNLQFLIYYHKIARLCIFSIELEHLEPFFKLETW